MWRYFLALSCALTKILCQDEIETPLPSLGLLAAQCRLLINTPQDIDPSPDGFTVTEESGIKFLIDHQADELHAHFTPGDTDNDQLNNAVLEFEVTVIQTEDQVQVAQMAIGTAMWAAHANSLHIPIPEVADESVVQVQVVVIYHLQDEGLGEEIVLRSPTALYPNLNTGECCPLGHPAPTSSPADPVWTGGITEGDIFADSDGHTWSYWCHNGQWKSCFMVPDGFSDPNNERFTAVGEVATFISDDDGSEAQFKCTFRPQGDEEGSLNNRDVELSGGFQSVIEVDVLQEPPVPVAGLLTSVCEVTFASTITVPASPPDFHVIQISDAVSDNFNVIVNPLDQADIFHIEWNFPLLPPTSGLRLTGYEITTIQEGSVQEIASLSVPAFTSKASIPVGNANTEDLIATSISALYVDAEGGEHRSELVEYPPTTRACCPGNHPIPRAIPEPIDFPSTGETEVNGEFYITESNGNTFTYFCHGGRYKSCAVVPAGFTDPNNERFQEVGGRAFFLNEQTGTMTEFLCQLSETGDVGNSVHPTQALISGRYQKFFSIATEEENSIEDGDVEAQVSESTNSAVFIAISAAFATAFVVLVIYMIMKRKSSARIEIPQIGSPVSSFHDSDLSLHAVQYKQVEEA